ncbi:MAG: glycosyltransferase [Candidatus Methylacidiphilales bacterium]
MSYLYEFVTNALLFSALAFVASAVLVMYDKLFSDDKPTSPLGAYLGSTAFAVIGTWFMTGDSWLVSGDTTAIAVMVSLTLTLLVATSRPMRRFMPSGHAMLLTNGMMVLLMTVWGTWFIVQMDVSFVTKCLMFAGFPLILVTLPLSAFQALETWEVLIRREWLRPRGTCPIDLTAKRHFPKVLFQVPCYSEPPEVVMATMDELNKMDYPNYQVMIIDNNTKDENLWRPLEAYARKLGPKFIFIHVEGITGAKAGAMNYANKNFLTPDVEIISVVDADYHARPNFLKDLVGHFDNPKMGFVQTPHDYRDWQKSTYQRMCYWEYKLFFETIMPALNERDAALTVGTMCLIRRKALEEAGGWAEWCQTEDSELSIRIHAVGYSSVYTKEAYGFGIIPETFTGYKKQRFRWIAGPVQEFKHHIAMFLPKRWATPTQLTFLQKVHHLNHGMSSFTNGVGVMMTPVTLAIMLSMVINHDDLHMPAAIILAGTLVGLAKLGLTMVTYLSVMKVSFRDAVGGLTASCALAHTMAVASVIGVMSDKIPWLRTNKFKALPSGLAALNAAQCELILGACMIVAGLLIFSSVTGTLLALMALGMVVQGLSYGAAPFLALLSEREVQQRRMLEEGGLAEAEVAPAAAMVDPIATLASIALPHHNSHLHPGHHNAAVAKAKSQRLVPSHNAAIPHQAVAATRELSLLRSPETPVQ